MATRPDPSPGGSRGPLRAGSAARVRRWRERQRRGLHQYTLILDEFRVIDGLIASGLLHHDDVSAAEVERALTTIIYRPLGFR
jgi:hypothetical protein